MTDNPYQPPTGTLQDEAAADDRHPVRIRDAHMKQEASVKTVGNLMLMLGGFLVVISSHWWLVDEPWPDSALLMFKIITAAGVVTIMLGIGLRLLQPWARWLTILFSILGVFKLSYASFVYGGFLIVLLWPGAGTVFTRHYRRVVADTSHMEYRSNLLFGLQIAFGVLLLFIALKAIA